MGYKTKNEVKAIFNRISYSYDFLNSLLSLGLHKIWKKQLIDLLSPKSGEDWADLCCGSGDLSFLLSQKVFPNGSVTGIDSAKKILNIAKKRSKLVGNKFIKWKIQDVLEMDEKLQNYNGICMSYGLRNLEDVEAGIKKIFKLLRDEGRAGILDFNHPKLNSLSYKFQKIYLRLVVVPVSRIFKLRQEYAYIEKSIKNFPEGSKLIVIAKKAGFKNVEYKTIFGNQMGILILKK